MTEYINLKVKDVRRAHDNACEDGKKIIKDMCPKAFEGEKKYCCDWMRYAVEDGVIFDMDIYPKFRYLFNTTQRNSAFILLQQLLTNAFHIG